MSKVDNMISSEIADSNDAGAKLTSYYLRNDARATFAFAAFSLYLPPYTSSCEIGESNKYRQINFCNFRTYLLGSFQDQKEIVLFIAIIRRGERYERKILVSRCQNLLCLFDVAFPFLWLLYNIFLEYIVQCAKIPVLPFIYGFFDQFVTVLGEKLCFPSFS